MTENNAPRIRILFVDDDRDVLDGFKRVLFKMRKEWDMEFVTNGEEALDLLEKTPFDAVVSDIGMSGISGTELFRVTKEKHPEVARIIISGSAGMDHLVKAVGIAHQFLLKPVNAELLKKTLSRVISLRNYLKDRRIKRIVNRMDSLPTQPQRHLELVEAIYNASIKEIAEIIKQDLAMTTKILQLVNSPFWGIKNRIEDIYHAVTLIGVDVLRALVLTLEIFAKFQLKGILKDELNAVFNHSHDVAHYARLITLEITHDKTMANDSYMCGLIHDVGKLIVLSQFTESYFSIKERSLNSHRMPYLVEREILEVDHSQLGAYLLGLWGLPEFLVETAAYHHNLEGYLCDEFSPVLAVHIADAIKHGESGDTVPKSGLPAGLALDCLEKLGPGLVQCIPDMIIKIKEIKENRIPEL